LHCDGKRERRVRPYQLFRHRRQSWLSNQAGREAIWETIFIILATSFLLSHILLKMYDYMHTSFAESGSRPSNSILAEYEYGSSYRIQGFDNQKLTQIYSWKIFFDEKIANYLSLGLHKGCPSPSGSALRREYPALQNLKVLNYFLFLGGSFLPSWIRN
jgi:hypothetical protein